MDPWEVVWFGFWVAAWAAGIVWIAYAVHSIRTSRAGLAENRPGGRADVQKALRDIAALRADQRRLLAEGRASLERARDAMRKGIRG
jgi:hypothetical protein